LTGKQAYDVVIIGGGPAGLTAGIYTARARLRSLLIEKAAPGGWIVNAGVVENYPGFPQGISGMELADLMNEQAAKFGMETLTAEVTGLELKGEQKLVRTTEGDIVAKAVIIAGGSDRAKLGVPGEEEFMGRGVAFCAVCDAYFYRDLPVVVVGGGNAAINEALELSKFASKVTAIEGGDVVERLRLRNVLSGEKSTLDISGIFVATGTKPNTDYLKGVLPLDASGAITTNEKMETEVSGIFAAGDIRSNSIRQVAAAIGDGAVAAIYAEKFITS